MVGNDLAMMSKNTCFHDRKAKPAAAPSATARPIAVPERIEQKRNIIRINGRRAIHNRNADRVAVGSELDADHPRACVWLNCSARERRDFADRQSGIFGKKAGPDSVAAAAVAASSGSRWPASQSTRLLYGTMAMAQDIGH